MTEFKKLEKVESANGSKSVKLKDTVIGDKVIFKLTEFTQPMVKDVSWQGKSFKSVSIKALYEGDECYLNLTPALATQFEQNNWESGQDLVISVVPNSKRAGQKLYLIGKYQEKEFTTEDQALANEVKKLANDGGIEPMKVDYCTLKETLTEMGKPLDRIDEVYSAYRVIQSI
jgi:hypothetical protein